LYGNYTAIFTELRQFGERDMIGEEVWQGLNKRFEEMSKVIEVVMEAFDRYQEFFGVVGLERSGRGNGYCGYHDLLSSLTLGRGGRLGM
jgi:hypothetical protein